MLGKLLKHDFKSTVRVLLPLQLVLIGVTILGMIILSLFPFQRPESMLLMGGMIITYTLMVVALSVITQIFLIVFFYRSMFTHQGYLTFTLPATPWSLLHSKAIMGFVWGLINTLLTYLSVLMLIASAVGFANFGSAMRELFHGEMAYTDVIINGVSTVLPISILDILGLSLPQLLLYLVALTLISAFYSVAVGYGSVAIGQLYAKHKVAGTVLAYLAIYFVMQIFSGVIAFVAAMRSVIQVVQEAPPTAKAAFQTMGQIYSPMFLAILLFQLVVGIGLYVAAGIIMNKKVNLD